MKLRLMLVTSVFITNSFCMDSKPDVTIGDVNVAMDGSDAMVIDIPETTWELSFDDKIDDLKIHVDFITTSK